MRALRSLPLAFAALACLTSAASAQAPERHMGVQLRALAGPAVLHAFQDAGGGQTNTITGVATAFNFVLGSMVSDNLAVNLDLVLSRAGNADHGVLEDTTFAAVHFGAGVTYWIMPANVFLAGSLGAARSSVEGTPIRIDIEIPDIDPSRVGVGVHLSAGKLWWIARRWGLGASLSLLASTASNPDGGIDTERNVLGAAVALSATFH
ncbi:MAG: hypothetical protein OXT09_27930 [Myxococcales bacterium]|nr:hypothetical protein [Myxococcales bacterium]